MTLQTSKQIQNCNQQFEQPDKQYKKPRIDKLGDVTTMTLSFGQSLIRDLRGRFPIDPFF